MNQPGKCTLKSTVGQKFLMGLTGLGLVGFIVMHLLGNVKLFLPEGQAFNQYAENLEKFGVWLYVAEIGLVALFLVHIVSAIRVTIRNKRARPQGYRKVRSKGGPTKNTLSSRNMIVSGILLLVFLIFHILHFKYGPGVKEGYVTQYQGEQMRDLYRLVIESFHDPLYVGLYVGAMLFLGFHIRHGFWSMFQSLGALTPKCSRPMYWAGILVALVLAGGFLLIPLWIYFDLGGRLK